MLEKSEGQLRCSDEIKDLLLPYSLGESGRWSSLGLRESELSVSFNVNLR